MYSVLYQLMWLLLTPLSVVMQITCVTVNFHLCVAQIITSR